MTGLHYPDNLYADHEERKARRSQEPTGAYRSTDPVTKPAHYQRAGIETIDYIRATLSAPGFEAYCIGNVLKYVSRYREKGGVEDLRKAQVYLGWAINPKTDGFNPAAMREAKIAYDTAFEDDAWRLIGKAEANLAAERIPKWHPAWGVGTTGFPAPKLHPMQAETLRDHDERLAGGEDRL